jgi:hypothetical protein
MGSRCSRRQKLCTPLAAPGYSPRRRAALKGDLFAQVVAMTAPDAIALAVSVVGLAVVFVRLRRAYKQNLPRDKGEPC